MRPLARASADAPPAQWKGPRAHAARLRLSAARPELPVSLRVPLSWGKGKPGHVASLPSPASPRSLTCPSQATAAFSGSVGGGDPGEAATRQRAAGRAPQRGGCSDATLGSGDPGSLEKGRGPDCGRGTRELQLSRLATPGSAAEGGSRPEGAPRPPPLPATIRTLGEGILFTEQNASTRPTRRPLSPSAMPTEQCGGSEAGNGPSLPATVRAGEGSAQETLHGTPRYSGGGDLRDGPGCHREECAA